MSMRQRMLRTVFTLALAVSAGGAGLRAQQDLSKSDAVARVAELKQSIAANRAQL